MAAPALTFVTTCKGRLQYLRETLPRLVAEPDAACVVVDYACPDHAGDWIEANLPQVRVVRSPESTGFNPSHARNLGVAAVQSDIVCLIDADVLIARDFVATMLAQFNPREYRLPEPLTGDVSGTFVCARAAFEFAEGYDEVCTGWGGEDFDLYERLDYHGLRRNGFPASLLRALPHSDAQRTEHHSGADKNFTNSVNLLYSHIKLDLMRLSGNRVPLEFRRSLYAQVRATCAASAAQRKAVRIEVPYAGVDVNFSRLQTDLLYTIDMTAPPRP